MSYLKTTWLRPAASLLVVLAIAVLWLTGASSTEAGNPGSVVISPASASVGVGGTTTVSVDVTAPDGGLSVWIIEIAYDPSVVQVDTSGGNPVCTSPAVTGTNFHGEGCAAKSVPSGGSNNTAVAFGAWVLNSGGTATGWTGTHTVATFTFRATGTAGQSSPLTISVCDDCFLRPDTSEATPTTTNGTIEITSGTTKIWGDSDCSGGVAPRDSQANLKHFLSQTELSQTAPCFPIGSSVTVDGTSRVWGDSDCSGGVAPRDSQANLKHFLSQTELSQTEPCPDIGSSVTVS